MIATTPPLPLHLGFTGSRRGMSDPQLRAVSRLLTDLADIHRVPIIAHHGCCVGADEDFHALARERGWRVIGHPGPDWPDGPLCAYAICGETVNPAPYPVRNQAIVDAASVMIATPLEVRPQPRGGTWSTVRMALRALRAGGLRELHVVGRDGAMLDHARWP
jgi:hypothetical protein